MSTQLAKWGNSLAVRIPAGLAERARLEEGDRVELSVAEDGALVIRAVSRPYDLDELVAGITPENRHDETDWGEPVGKETW